MAERNTNGSCTSRSMYDVSELLAVRMVIHTVKQRSSPQQGKYIAPHVTANTLLALLESLRRGSVRNLKERRPVQAATLRTCNVATTAEPWCESWWQRAAKYYVATEHKVSHSIRCSQTQNRYCRTHLLAGLEGVSVHSALVHGRCDGNTENCTATNMLHMSRGNARADALSVNIRFCAHAML